MLRFIRITLAAMTALTVTSLAACSSNDTAAGSTISIAASLESPGQTLASEQETVYGKVTAIDGNTLTISVGTWNVTAAASSGSESTDLLTMTGETLTLTVTDATEFSKTVSLSDIATGSVLKITYDTKTSEAVSIAILSGAGLTGAPGQPGSSTGSSSGST